MEFCHLSSDIWLRCWIAGIGCQILDTGLRPCRKDWKVRKSEAEKIRICSSSERKNQGG